MSIDVKATNVKLWKNERQGRNGTFFTYSVSASRKQQDGSYKHKSMKVFTKETIPEEIPNGALCDIDGFLTLDTYMSNGTDVTNIAIYANVIEFKDYEASNFEQVDDDVSF